MKTRVIVDSFQASHSVALESGSEPVHGHEWKLRAEIIGDSPEADAAVEAAVAPLRGAVLNDNEAIARGGASAEALARYLHDEISGRLSPPQGVLSIALEEEPGCWAVYRKVGGRR